MADFPWSERIGLACNNDMKNIANAIRYKRSTTDDYYIKDMAELINKIVGFPPTCYALYSDTGETFVGPLVVDMSRAFCDKPYAWLSSGPNVVNMSYSYANCGSINGTLLITQNFANGNTSPLLVNGYMMFLGRDFSEELYINVPLNSAWNSWFRTSCTIYGDTPLRWTPASEDYLYNAETKTFLTGKIGDCVDLNHFTVNPDTTEFNVAFLQVF